MYRVEWSERATRQLERVDRPVARAIVRFMHKRVHSTGNQRARGKPLRSDGLWRYRIADYRVLCRIQDQILIVLVVKLGHRREVYR